MPTAAAPKPAVSRTAKVSAPALTSALAQNAWPAPVSTTARTASSASQAR
jgi:hypothetical protein